MRIGSVSYQYKSFDEFDIHKKQLESEGFCCASYSPKDNGIGQTVLEGYYVNLNFEQN